MTTTPTSFGEPYVVDRNLSEDLMAIFRRRKLVIVLVLIATVITAYFALFLVSEQYEAEARLLVKLGRENTEVPISVDKGGVYTTGVQKEEINSYIKLLGSRTLIEDAVDRVGLARFYQEKPEPTATFAKIKYHVKRSLRWVKKRWRELLVLLDIEKELGDRDAAIQNIERLLKVERERDSNVILISLRMPDALLAKDVIAAMIHNYMARHVELRRDVNTRGIFEREAELRRKQLEEVQRTLADIKREYSLSSISEQRVKLLDRLHDLKRQSDSEESELLALRNQQALVRTRLESRPKRTMSSEVVEPNPGLKSIKEHLLALQVERIRSAGRYSEGAQPLVIIDEEIAQLQKLLATEQSSQSGDVTYAPDPLYGTLERDLEQLDVRIAGLEASLGVHKKQTELIDKALSELNVGEDKMRMAELDRSVIEQEYLSYVRRSENAHIDEQLDQRRVANVAVLSPPAMDFTPVYPPRRLMMGIAVGIGLLLGMGMALMIEWKSDIVHGTQELLRIPGLPLLGVFHLEEGKSRA